ncbi:seven-hairpin glycosidase [Meira miltonrushii]|uniref:alpha-1,2-Mannosidase n=1 Tax=Meira miltonrushii TaxID=1280837 RepID=A0A316V4E0_9BASI|nr:seven-hairpin glycosidase [Meira miltonrushii]PWN32390.1 seven-hairpin glycosidase [Meira miltonrushii]
MKSLSSWAALLSFALLGFEVIPSFAGKIQSDQAKADPSRRAAVKQAFQSAFGDYLEYAYGYDELLPLTKNGTGGFGNWGATFIDALDTAKIMGLEDIVNEGIRFAEKVDFSQTSQSTISLFETNIRYVASLLSLYELTGNTNQNLVNQAKVIGDKLLKGWSGNNNIPDNSLNDWTSGPFPDTSVNANIAEAGTLLLEFSRLSKFTGNSSYLDHAVRSMRAIINSTAVFPGLYAQSINPTTAEPVGDYVTWSGGSDSFFEYLVKYGQLIGSTDIYIPTWINSVKSSIQHLITMPGDTSANVTILSDYSASNGGLIPQFTHLGCFAGGNWILGGKLLDSNEIFQYGLDLANACVNTYTSSVTGIGPEVFVFKTDNGGTNGVTISNETFYKEHGFDYAVPTYYLRPEVLESVFYAYRSTGDKRWQDLAWTAFNSIIKYCKAPAALASISQVNNTQTTQINDSESFLYAELFKYLFLIFDDPNVISLDTYVFNTEAHPFKVENPNADYSGAPVGTIPSPGQGQDQGRTLSPSSTQRTSAPRPLTSGLSSFSFMKSLTFQKEK